MLGAVTKKAAPEPEKNPLESPDKVPAHLLEERKKEEERKKQEKETMQKYITLTKLNSKTLYNKYNSLLKKKIQQEKSGQKPTTDAFGSNPTNTKPNPEARESSPKPKAPGPEKHIANESTAKISSQADSKNEEIPVNQETSLVVRNASQQLVEGEEPQQPFSVEKSPYMEEPLNFPLLMEVQIDHNRPNFQNLFLTLILDKDKIITSSVNETMHECLMEIQAQLPKNLYIESCWSCSRSMYSPLTKSNFQGLGCFIKNPNTDYTRTVKGIFDMWLKKDKVVQEVFGNVFLFLTVVVLLVQFVEETRPKPFNARVQYSQAVVYLPRGTIDRNFAFLLSV